MPPASVLVQETWGRGLDGVLTKGDFVSWRSTYISPTLCGRIRQQQNGACEDDRDYPLRGLTKPTTLGS